MGLGDRRGAAGHRDPADWDAVVEHGERRLGTAAIGLALNCPLEEASPRIARATRLPDRDQRGVAFTAVGTAARLTGALTPELYAVLRAEGPRSMPHRRERRRPSYRSGSCRRGIGTRDRGNQYLAMAEDGAVYAGMDHVHLLAPTPDEALCRLTSRIRPEATP